MNQFKPSTMRHLYFSLTAVGPIMPNKEDDIDEEKTIQMTSTQLYMAAQWVYANFFPSPLM